MDTCGFWLRDGQFSSVSNRSVHYTVQWADRGRIDGSDAYGLAGPVTRVSIMYLY